MKDLDVVDALSESEGVAKDPRFAASLREHRFGLIASKDPDEAIAQLSSIDSTNDRLDAAAVVLSRSDIDLEQLVYSEALRSIDPVQLAPWLIERDLERGIEFARDLPQTPELLSELGEMVTGSISENRTSE